MRDAKVFRYSEGRVLMPKKPSDTAAARARRSHLSRVINEMPVGVAFYDDAGKLVGGNALWQEYHRLDTRDAASGTAYESHARTGANRATRVYDTLGRETDALSTEFQPDAIEGRFTAQIDETLWLDIRNRRTSDGGVVSVQSDISEQVARQERLGNEQSILQSAIAAMPSGISAKDPRGRYMAFNQKIVELFDLPDGMIRVNGPFEDVARYQAARGDHGDGTVEALVSREVDILQTLDIKVYEKTLATGRTLELRRSKLPDGGIVTIAADVSDRVAHQAALQKAKLEAEQASRAKTRFLANMSHELRTPLNAVIGFSDIMLNQTFGPLGSARYVDYAENINGAGKHLMAVIDDILDISKIEAGKLELQEEVVPLREIIADCTGMMADRAQRAGVHLRTRVPEHFPRVRADPVRLRQIILNLLSNALKFSPEDSLVTLALSRAAGGAPVIEVSDSGPGIDPADIPRVLEPFGQVGNTTSNAEGTGLGLSVSRELAELHGGQLEIESELGRGTTVRILLRRDCVVEG